MSVYGQWVAATIPSGDTSSAAIDLGREYDFISLQIPELDDCLLWLKVAEKLGSTYYNLGRDTTANELHVFGRSQERIDEEDANPEDKFLRADVWRLGGWRYVKVVSSIPQSAERLIRVCGMRY